MITDSKLPTLEELESSAPYRLSLSCIFSSWSSGRAVEVARARSRVRSESSSTT